MNFIDNKAENVKIAYIGGGSRGWAWGLMSDLAKVEDMSGSVYLYDIDYQAALNNEIIGNRIKDLPECKTAWNYKAVETIGEALTGADFVVISILPGTFDEMESDVHVPEKYGIWQSVGDTTGPGGIMRALRTIPMMEVIARAIEEHAPNAWVINYTNPMTVCMMTLYRVFPKIKAFGCCHEVFSTQKVLASALNEICGIAGVKRDEIKVNVVGINHYTWFTKAEYRNMDLFDVYRKLVDKYADEGYGEKDNNWSNNTFACNHRVKMDLFKRFGYIAAAGDRHLAEFCSGSWYLKNPDHVHSWGFSLTTVKWRKENSQNRSERSYRLLSGEEPFVIEETGEEGVKQMRALLGLCDLVTNVNIPNVGQIPNVPMGAVVETNAVFRSNSLTPVFAGDIPTEIYPLISRIVGEQKLIVEAGAERNLEKAFIAFINDPLMTLDTDTARLLFDEMVSNGGKYMSDYRY